MEVAEASEGSEMSVHLSLAENQPKAETGKHGWKAEDDGKEYRHFSATCSVLKESGAKVKNNVPNTKALQARTVRCPNPSHDEKTGCWELYEDSMKNKKTRAGTRATKASKQPAKQSGGKAGSIAAKAAQARKKKPEKAEEKKEPVEATA